MSIIMKRLSSQNSWWNPFGLNPPWPLKMEVMIETMHSLYERSHMYQICMMHKWTLVFTTSINCNYLLNDKVYMWLRGYSILFTSVVSFCNLLFHFMKMETLTIHCLWWVWIFVVIGNSWSFVLQFQ